LPYFIDIWFTVLLLDVFCIFLHSVWDSRNQIIDLKKISPLDFTVFYDVECLPSYVNVWLQVSWMIVLPWFQIR